jgi:acyl-CoA thioester hydrolase
MKNTVEIKPRYSDTDQMGVIYHGNYFSYFEIARTNLFEVLGYSYRQIEDEGIILPVTEANCRYKKAIKYGEKILVEAEVDFIKRVTIGFNYTIYRKSDKEVLATGYTHHGFVSKDLKPVRFKDFNPDFQNILKQLKNKNE